ncbi:MAG: CHASE3 domain-containing protein [Steroidobacteraceae bacterium]
MADGHGLPWRQYRNIQLDFWDGLRLLPGSIWLPIVAISLLGLGVYVVNEWSVSRIRVAAESVNRTLGMQNEVIAMRSQLVDLESAQRGYLLTTNRRYLAPYESALPDLQVISARLRMLAAGDAEILQHVTRLEELRGLKIAEVTASISLTQRGDRANALAILRTGEGRKVMDRFRSGADALIGVLDSRLASLREEQARSLVLSRYAFAALALLTLALIVLVVRLFVADSLRREGQRYEEEHERRRLEVIIEDRTRELSQLTTHLQSASEQEKADLARDLHDELGGLLTAANMDLAWLQGRSVTMEQEVRDKLGELVRTVTEAMNLKRRVVENLRPALLDHFGLPTALEAYFDETCKRAGLECRTSIPEETDPIPQALAIALFRVGQESLTNIIRHARARKVEMSFEVGAAGYHLGIGDDGIGMDPERARSSHGLSGMRHRVVSLNGSFEIQSAPGQGTRLDVLVPFAGPEARA